VDPGVSGSYQTVDGEYQLSDLKLPDYPRPVEMTGYVVAPDRPSETRPLVLFMHGLHRTCYAGESLTSDWPCKDHMQPVPSHRGYERIQQLLASQGYVTVSIATNGINAQDDTVDAGRDDRGAQARSSLVRAHLGKWADWAAESGRAGAPDVVRKVSVPDMAKVMLVGHSRGGEGVNRAAVDSLSPPPAAVDGYHGAVRWQIRGLALIGPTQYSQNPAPDVPSMAILPSCDGDISDLQGQVQADETRGVSHGLALHSSVVVIGANHNYFNSEWTPGVSQAPSSDDANPNNPSCGSGAPIRITPEQQQTVGATYLAAAAATFVAGDDRVLPLLDGSGVRARSAGSVTVLSHAVGANRTPLVVPGEATEVSGGRLCQADCSSTPHFVPFDVFRPDAGRFGVEMDFTSTGTPVTIQDPGYTSLSAATQVALRIAVASTAPGTAFDVAITDADGRRATLGTATLDALPESGETATHWAQEVRMPLTNATAAGLDLRKIASLEIVPRTVGGSATLIDAWGWRPGLPAPQTGRLPRVDVGEVTVQEGDSGTTTVEVPLNVSSSIHAGKVRVFVHDLTTGKSTSQVVYIANRSTRIGIPITITGNTNPHDSRAYKVGVKAFQRMAVGDAFGTLTVRDDDA
ncbi:MAG TPA: hypothetical protein VFO77_10730, partial [Actinoplanes sp.]|nr:hypothetical protein [Actinoplanes sp.]